MTLPIVQSRPETECGISDDARALRVQEYRKKAAHSQEVSATHFQQAFQFLAWTLFYRRKTLQAVASASWHRLGRTVFRLSQWLFSYRNAARTPNVAAQ